MQINQHKLFFLVSAAFTPMVAHAQPVTGWYASTALGLNLSAKTSEPLATGFDTFQAQSGRLWTETNPGMAGSLSLGWGYGNGLRVELEASHRRNDLRTASGRTFDGILRTEAASPGGSISTSALMSNILYDFTITDTPIGPVFPYLGFGAGVAYQQWNNVKAVLALEDVVRIDDAKAAFAYQLIAGMSFPVSDIPGLSFTVDYRYFASLESTFSGTYDIESSGNFRNTSVKASSQNQSVLIGLRYAFNAAPSVAPEAPLAAAQTYLVFFDWNRADLTARAKQIIGEAATGRGQGVTRIEVNGYTDRSGSDQYNQGLSTRRANAVAAELLRRGVPRNEIFTRAFGEANPLIPTADGVREAQNRRVEIILR
ncbi:MAG: hypothetical protein RIS83_527 [Pseudomonadota bacterium]